MAVENLLCEKCSKSAVCKIMDIIMKFDEGAKNQLGVNIKVVNCFNFDEDIEGD